MSVIIQTQGPERNSTFVLGNSGGGVLGRPDRRQGAAGDVHARGLGPTVQG